MLKLKFNIICLPIVSKALFCHQYACYFQGKINTVAKRGSMLKDMVANKDKKRKHWHLEFVSTKPKVRMFEKIHKPHRRKAVLNSVLLSNITDVISTGDVAPGLEKYNIEISGLSISQCMKILNVFWQVPSSDYDSCNDIEQILATAAPKIRAELISRNVLGQVPLIFFLRDSTNERIAEYELAVKKIELEPNIDTGIVCDDSFTENMYSFNDYRKSKVAMEKISKLALSKQTEGVVVPETPCEPAPCKPTPYKPTDMKSDVGGLDHALIMCKVISLKNKTEDPLQHVNVISPETLNSTDDLFSNIPGICFQAQSSETESRNVILRKFHIARKMRKEKNKDKSGDPQSYDEDDEEFNSLEDSGDFIDDETTDNTH